MLMKKTKRSRTEGAKSEKAEIVPSLEGLVAQITPGNRYPAVTWVLRLAARR